MDSKIKKMAKVTKDIGKIDVLDLKKRILVAGEKSVLELIDVLNSPILNDDESDLTADKLKNAVSARKLAMKDSIEILGIIEGERLVIEDMEKHGKQKTTSGKGFAEGRAT